MLLKSYLQGTFFQVKYDDHLLSLRKIEVGVPQGSVLGPVLYTVYIDGIPTSEEVMTTTYANDTPQLFCCKNSETASSRLQLHLNKVGFCLGKWRIKTSVAKSTQNSC